MRTAIVGPGAIGCLLAAFLAEKREDVWLVDRNAGRAGLLNSRGVRVEDAGEHRVVPVRTTAVPSEIGPVDVVCICVKAYDTEGAVLHARPLLGPGTAVVSLQNGLGNVETMARHSDASRVICAVTGHGVVLLGDGHVRHAGRGPTLVAARDPRERVSAAAFAELLTAANIGARCVDDAVGMLWSKLVVNAAVNPLTAVHNVRNGALVEDPDLAATLADAAREAEQVAHAEGVSLFFDDAAAEAAAVCRRTKDNLSSMLQDVRKGRRTEIDAINGRVVELGRKAGVGVAVNAGLMARVREIEARG